MEIITTEEYNSVLERLEEIAQEYQNLENNAMHQDKNRLAYSYSSGRGWRSEILCWISKEIPLTFYNFAL